MTKRENSQHICSRKTSFHGLDKQFLEGFVHQVVVDILPAAQEQNNGTMGVVSKNGRSICTGQIRSAGGSVPTAAARS
jgi:hypothetical protein